MPLATPFVKTPLGIGVVEGSVKRLTPAGSELFVRFEDGSHHWLMADNCEQVEAPVGYETPSLCDLPGAVVR